MSDPDDAEEQARKASERARVEAFLAELSELCTRHGMYIDAWARYADDAFFGVEVDPGAPTKYELEPEPWARAYEVSRPHVR